MNCTVQVLEHSATGPERVSGAPSVAHVGVADVVVADVVAAKVLAYFNTLSDALGPMYWWPARTPFEVIVGAILTQNTAWSNVERALVNLRRERLLTPRAIERVATPRLARRVRPAGCYRQKTRKLKEFVRFLRRQYGGSLMRMFRTPTLELRERLLAVHGIGPETADSILLYAGGHAIFVVDAYTHRIFERHGLHAGKPDYERVRAMVESSLPREAHVYNEFHALLVRVGKHWCRARNPKCQECALRAHLPADSTYRSALRGRDGYERIAPLFTLDSEGPA
jgi:endonuclease III related protein